MGADAYFGEGVAVVDVFGYLPVSVLHLIRIIIGQCYYDE